MHLGMIRFYHYRVKINIKKIIEIVFFIHIILNYLADYGRMHEKAVN